MVLANPIQEGLASKTKIPYIHRTFMVLPNSNNVPTANPIKCLVTRVGQSRVYTLCMSVKLLISRPKIPYTHQGTSGGLKNLRFALS